MSANDTLVQRLGVLEETQLAALLERRPDVLLGAAPRDLPELAQRLRHPQSLVTVLRTVPVSHLQLLEAAQALGDACNRVALTEFLTGDGSEQRAAVDAIVDELAAYAVLVVDGGRIVLPAALADIFPDPLGLGEPLRVLLRDRSVEDMRTIQTGLGLPKQQNRADTVESLVARLGDAAAVRATFATAPDDVARVLAGLADRRLVTDEVFYSPNRQRQAAIEWAVARGLMIGMRYGYDWRMPAEVARALRGPDHHAPFTPRRPEPATWPVDPARVESDSSAAATLFADHVLAVLDRAARTPVACVKSGGVGARELAKLAKATGTGETEVRLVLELAAAAGLLERFTAGVTGSEEFATWRDLDPGDRFAALLSAWWSLGKTPTEARDFEGKSMRVLDHGGHCDGCRAARVSLLDTLAGLDGAADCAPVAVAAMWRRPLVHVVAQDETRPLATVWREAELLGVIAQGTVTELGRLLLAGSADLLAKHAGSLLPESAERATFGADLTVYVAGAPPARISRLLDSVADRESRGGAVTWRFSPGSVRRALDDGTTGDALAAALADIATTGLPQPLRYLIADVARRHGNLRLTAAVTCVRSADPALLAEVAADRKLAKLGLRLLAPTVLAADVPLADLLAALRAAGYFPVSEDTAPSVTLRSTDRTRVARPPSRTRLRERAPEPAAADPSAVAADLLRGGSGQRGLFVVPPLGPGSEEQLSGMATSLSTAEIRQLAHAVDTGSPVRIEYVSSTGATTDRVIDQAELSGGSLFAWCELRQDERVFTVARIRSVVPV